MPLLGPRPPSLRRRRSCSYLEGSRIRNNLEQRISEAEEQLKAARAAYEDPSGIASIDAVTVFSRRRLNSKRAEQVVDQLYGR